jgi:hypothetical protein
MSEQNPEELIQTRLLTRGIRPRIPISLCWRKRYCLIGILVLCLLSGMIFPFVAEGSRVYSGIGSFMGLICIVLTLLWCKYDSYERDYQIKPILTFCIVLLGCIGVPFYLFLTRGWRGFVSIILLILFLGVCTLAKFLGAGAMCLITGIPLSW